MTFFILTAKLGRKLVRKSGRLAVGRIVGELRREANWFSIVRGGTIYEDKGLSNGLELLTILLMLVWSRTLARPV